MAKYEEITTTTQSFDHNNSSDILYIGLKNKSNNTINKNVKYSLNTLSNNWCTCKFTELNDGICKVTISVDKNDSTEIRSCNIELHCNNGFSTDITNYITIRQNGIEQSNQFWVKSLIQATNSIHVFTTSIGSSQDEINNVLNDYKGQVLMHDGFPGDADWYYGYLDFTDNNTIRACDYYLQEAVEVPIGDTVWIYFSSGNNAAWGEVIVCRNTAKDAIVIR